MLLRAILCLHVLFLLNFAVESKNSRSRRAYRSNVSDDERKEILLYHNRYRSNVQPTASNMLCMTWHSNAARQAQRYAERCQFLKHNNAAERTVSKLGSCGQNIYVSTKKAPWSYALKSWSVEHKKFTYGSPASLSEIGHYTQMVWATSHKVGCGMAHCSGGPWGKFYNYVCHYCPAGNYGSVLQYPYKRGKPCGDCPKHCVSGSLCSNSCNEHDYYSNCAELVRTDGYCNKGTCNATCVCGNERIHKNHPFF